MLTFSHVYADFAGLKKGEPNISNALKKKRVQLWFLGMEPVKTLHPRAYIGHFGHPKRDIADFASPKKDEVRLMIKNGTLQNLTFSHV